MTMALGQERYVGRQPHLRLVAELVDKTRQGSGGLLLVSGEPGLGKTRLAEEATRLASAAGLAVAWGQSAEAEGAPPYLPWTQIFTQLGSSFLRQRALESRNASRAEASRFRVFDRAVDVLRESSTGGPLLLVLDDLHAADA
jgi:ATP/maltotriose-dependent transcriptional regulator MalT